MEERQLQHVHESALHELCPFFFVFFSFLFGFAYCACWGWGGRDFVTLYAYFCTFMHEKQSDRCCRCFLVCFTHLVNSVYTSMLCYNDF